MCLPVAVGGACWASERVAPPHRRDAYPRATDTRNGCSDEGRNEGDTRVRSGAGGVEGERDGARRWVRHTEHTTQSGGCTLRARGCEICAVECMPLIRVLASSAVVSSCRLLLQREEVVSSIHDAARRFVDSTDTGRWCS